MKKSQKYLILLLLIVLQGSFIALCLKAGVGVGAWDAINQSMGFVFDIKVGHMYMILNSLLVALQFILLGKNFDIKILSQVLVTIVMSSIINYCLYDLYTFEIESYYVNLAIFIIANAMTALVLGIIINMGVINFPVESFSQVFADKFKVEFVKVRLSMDLISIIISLAITFFLAHPLIVREGTIIGALIFSPLLGISLKKTKIPMMKLGLANQQA